MNASQEKSEKGFTLIEVTIVTVIIGILLALLSSALLTFLQTNKIRTTEVRLAAIEESLADYLNVNRAYPCVADRTLSPESTDFGRKVSDDCDGGAGVVVDGDVIIGAVPNRELNLPDEFAEDSWGNKLTYAVTRSLTDPFTFTPDGGAISIVDSTGTNSLISPEDSAHYVISSHGASGIGSFPLFGSPTPPILCNQAGRDEENCDNDSTFMSSITNSDAEGAEFFDDYLSYRGQTAPVFAPIPVGAIIPFNLSSGCPGDGTEWREYAPARGKFVIGSNPAGLNMAQSEAFFPTPVITSNISIDTGEVSADDGDYESNLPPYIALIYCEKL